MDCWMFEVIGGGWGIIIHELFSDQTSTGLKMYKYMYVDGKKFYMM